MSKVMTASKGIGIGVIGAVVVAIALGVFGGFTSNTAENWTIVQRPVDWFKGGDPDVGDGKIVVADEKEVFIIKFFGDEQTYPDRVTEFFSDVDGEGVEDNDGDTVDRSVKVVFMEKGTARFSAQVVYETPFTLKEQYEFHKMAKGRMATVSKTVQTALNESCRFVATKRTASEFFEQQQEVVQELNTLMKSNTLLKDEWKIRIIDVQISNITPDDKTEELFVAQQEALLNAKTAEANKEKFKQEEQEKVAEYAKLIAEEKGKAEMIKMKDVTDAKRVAELATIEAQKKVDVAKLEKIQAEEIKAKALINATQKLEVAEIEKAEAVEKAQAIVELAKAEEEKIRLAGAMTEQERVRLEIQKEEAIGVASALVSGTALVPQFIVEAGGGEGGTGGNTALETLMTMRMVDDLVGRTNGVAKVTR